MKRDLDIVREIMLALEGNTGLNGRNMLMGHAHEFLTGSQYSPDELAYNLIQILESGLLEGEYVRASGSFLIRHITPAGHDWLDAIRQKSIWEHAKEATKDGGSASLQLIGRIASKLIEKQVEKHIGKLGE